MEGESKVDIMDMETTSLNDNICYGVPMKLNPQSMSTPATVCQAQMDITDMAFDENACYGVSLKLDSQNMSTPTIHQVQAEVTM